MVFTMDIPSCSKFIKLSNRSESKCLLSLLFLQMNESLCSGWHIWSFPIVWGHLAISAAEVGRFQHLSACQQCFLCVLFGQKPEGEGRRKIQSYVDTIHVSTQSTCNTVKPCESSCKLLGQEFFTLHRQGHERFYSKVWSLIIYKCFICHR